jgi:hypothetical protein
MLASTALTLLVFPGNSPHRDAARDAADGRPESVDVLDQKPAAA